jgi:hypothetical protein
MGHERLLVMGSIVTKAATAAKMQFPYIVPMFSGRWWDFTAVCHGLDTI